MKRDRLKAKGRREGGTFIAFPHACFNHANYIELGAYAIKLLFDLYGNYNGNNNGDFCCTWSMMKKRKWKSESTLSKARKELLYYGWIICSRHGGRNRASLYAVTFQPIDNCKGKLDIKETVTAPANWKEPKTPLKNKSLVREVEQLTMPTDVMVRKTPSFTTELLQHA